MLKNRIDSLKVRNYRSLYDVELHLDDITVLVGPNGSGKSNIIDVLRFVNDALNRGLDAAYRGRNIRPVGVEKPVTEIEIGMSIAGERAVYLLEVEHLDTEDYLLNLEKLDCGFITLTVRDGHVVSSEPGIDVLFEMTPPSRELSLPFLNQIQGYKDPFHLLSSINLYNVFPDSLRRPQWPQKAYPLLSDGQNLFSALRELIQQHPEQIQQLNAALSRIVPGILEANAIRVDALGQHLITQIQHENGLMDVAQESDGTLRMLALLTALYQVPPLPLIGMEEPELMVHPGAMGLLCDVLKEAATRSQIILTTHSPDLISRFEAENLRIVELEGGATKVGPVRDSDLSAINDQLFSGGDLLRIGGLRRAE